MNALAASVWFVCSVLNLSALILAWLYIFEVRTGLQRRKVSAWEAVRKAACRELPAWAFLGGRLGCGA